VFFLVVFVRVVYLCKNGKKLLVCAILSRCTVSCYFGPHF
jgi:hypothetical protein